MERVEGLRRESSSSQILQLGWRISFDLFCLASAILVVTLLATRLHCIDLSSVLLGIALVGFFIVLFFLSKSLLLLREEQRETATMFPAAGPGAVYPHRRLQDCRPRRREPICFWSLS